MESAKLKKTYEAAVEYVNKIGKPEPHFCDDNSVGRLHVLKVQTEIGHQASPSATNYWKDADFDAALCRAVRLNFAMLANEALEMMRSDYEEKRISEKAELLAQLAEIEALESGRGA